MLAMMCMQISGREAIFIHYMHINRKKKTLSGLGALVVDVCGQV
jgi:hypothetical protein